MEDEKVIPVIEEELHTELEPVKTGSVRVQKHVETRIERVEGDLLRDAVDVRRVPVNQEVKEMPRIRQEGEVFIVPVMEEEITVIKRLILKEELHIIRRQTREHVVQDVSLNRERAVVEHLDPQGRVIDARVEAKTEPGADTAAPTPKRRRSLLDP